MFFQINKKIINFAVYTFLILNIILPVVVFAQGSTQPPPSNTGLVYVCAGSTPGECTWDDFVNAVRRLVNWGTIFAIQFAVVVIAYAGANMLIYADNPTKRGDSKKMLLSVVKGMVFILLAWVIVQLILSGLQVVNIRLG